MKIKLMREKEFHNRVRSFQSLLKKEGVDAALILQKMDLYYLSGTDQDAILWVPAEENPILLVRKSMERAMKDSAIQQIFPMESPSQIPAIIRKSGHQRPSTLGLEMDILPVRLYQSFQKTFPGVHMVDISSLIRSVRAIKSPYEIALIRRAGELADGLFQKIPEFLRESETDTDLAIEAEIFYRRHGHPGISRMRGFNMETLYGHIMAGPHAAQASASPGPTAGNGPGPYLSQGAGRNKIRPHQPVLVDYTSNMEGYLSDQARIFSIGSLPAKLHQVHRAMIEIQDAIAFHARPGAVAGQLYSMALEMAKKAGVTRGFMGYPQPVPFIGHGLGLELDEWPVIGRGSEHILERGMVIALEPKVVFPGKGIVGVENTFLVTDQGMERLNRFPDEIAVLPEGAG